MNRKPQMLDRVRDKISGFEGAVTGITNYCTGCTRYCVQPTTLDKDGKIQDGYWIDEDRLEVIQVQAIAPLAPETEERLPPRAVGGAGDPTPRQDPPAR